MDSSPAFLHVWLNYFSLSFKVTYKTLKNQLLGRISFHIIRKCNSALPLKVTHFTAEVIFSFSTEKCLQKSVLLLHLSHQGRKTTTHTLVSLSCGKLSVFWLHVVLVITNSYIYSFSQSAQQILNKLFASAINLKWGLTNITAPLCTVRREFLNK